MSTASSEGRHAYGYARQVKVPVTEAVSRVTAALKNEGFGVLTEIDLRSKFKEKLGIDYREYVILGACDPTVAHQSLELEKDLGLLLPCNVVVYQENGGTVVAAVDAEKMLAVTGNTKLGLTAAAINERLRRAIDNV